VSRIDGLDSHRISLAILEPHSFARQEGETCGYFLECQLVLSSDGRPHGNLILEASAVTVCETSPVYLKPRALDSSAGLEEGTYIHESILAIRRGTVDEERG